MNYTKLTNLNNNTENNKILKLSILISIFLAVIKFLTGYIVNSSALIASSLDSIIDIISSSINKFILGIASLPADKDHAFGHGKFEAFSGLIQGIIIISITLLSFFHSIKNLTSHSNLTNVKDTQIAAIIVSLISIITPIILSIFIKKQAQKNPYILQYNK